MTYLSPPVQSGLKGNYMKSLLAMGIKERLLIVACFIIVLWFLVLWAL